MNKTKINSSLLNEATLSYPEQFHKMQELDNGTRGFNVAASIKNGDFTKVRYNYSLCVGERFTRAQKFIEDELRRLGYLNKIQDLMPQQNNTNSTNATTNNSSSNNPHQTVILFTDTDFDLEDGKLIVEATTTEPIIKKAVTVNGTIKYLLKSLILAICLKKDNIINNLKSILVYNCSYSEALIKQTIKACLSDPSIVKKLNEISAACLTESLTEAKKKKKQKGSLPFSSMTITTGDPALNIDHFNKCNGTDFDNDADKAAETANDAIADGAGDASSAGNGEGTGESVGEGTGSEGGAMGESLNEDKIYVGKLGGDLELPSDIHLISKDEVERRIEQLEPEEEFTVGYVNPIYLYKELWEIMPIYKCTEMSGYTGVDFAPSEDEVNKDKWQRIQDAKDQIRQAKETGKTFEVGSTVDYTSQNKLVYRHDTTDQNGVKIIHNTILFYPTSPAKVCYYVKLPTQPDFIKLNTEQLEKHIYDNLSAIKRKFTPDQVNKKIRTTLYGESDIDIDQATRGDAAMDQKYIYKYERNKHSVRALYTTQLYYLDTDGASIGRKLVESLNDLKEAKREVRRYYIRPQEIFCANKQEILKALVELEDQNCSIYSLKSLTDHDKDVTKLTNDDIIYYYDDGILYDKNHVKVLDYDLSIKHEEDRAKINPETISDKTFKNIYNDRITISTDLEEAAIDNCTDRQFIVYCHTNNINGKKYVGITSQCEKNRWRFGDGYKNQPIFYKAIQKYGWENFTHEIIADNLTLDTAKDLEKKLIAKYHTYVNDPLGGGYNASIGGEANLKYATAAEKYQAQCATNKKNYQNHKEDRLAKAKQDYWNNLELYKQKNHDQYIKHRASRLLKDKEYQASLKQELDIVRELNKLFPNRLSQEEASNILNFRNCRNKEYLDLLLAKFSTDEINSIIEMIKNKNYNNEPTANDLASDEYDDRMTSETVVEDINQSSDKYTLAEITQLLDSSNEGENIYIGYLKNSEYTPTEYFIAKEDGKYYIEAVAYTSDWDLDWEGGNGYNSIEELYEKEIKNLDLCRDKFPKSDELDTEDEFDLTFESYNAFGEKLTEEKEEVCCICGEPIEGYGNNPAPVKEEGRCCDSCNLKFVIPARLELLNKDSSK